MLCRGKVPYCMYQLCHFSSKRLAKKWHNWYSTARFLYTSFSQPPPIHRSPAPAFVPSYRGHSRSPLERASLWLAGTFQQPPYQSIYNVRWSIHSPTAIHSPAATSGIQLYIHL